MQQVYLDTDSKGIFPYDYEDRANYILRGKIYQDVGSNPKSIESVIRSAEENSKYALIDSKAPEKVYDRLIKRFDCDVRWMPYLRTFGPGLWKKIKAAVSTVAYCNKFYDDTVGREIPTVVMNIKRLEKGAAIHEFIHGIRMSIDEAHLGPNRAAIELFAEMDSLIPKHDLFLRYPIRTARLYSRMSKVKRKLKNCFNGKRDYALIRLKEEEINHLCLREMDEEKVKEYFKKRTQMLEGTDYVSTRGRLRFQIMCDKLGL